MRLREYLRFHRLTGNLATIIFIGFNLITTDISAQSTTIYLNGIYSSYSMTSFNHWENTLRNSTGTVKVKDLSFQNSLIVGGEIHLNNNEFSNGFFLGYGSTNGSISYETSSGPSLTNIDVNFKLLGGSIAVPIFRSDKISIQPGIRTSLIFGKLTITDNSVPGKELNAVSTNIGINPNISTTLNTAKRICVRVIIGYEFQIPGKLKDPENPDYYLINASTKNPIKLNIDGFRLGLSIGYIIRKEIK
ncbi:MAG: hypothetical protein ABJH04_00590 [Cyclobacteriaceae bacterium]